MNDQSKKRKENFEEVLKNAETNDFTTHEARQDFIDKLEEAHESGFDPDEWDEEENN